MQDRCEYKADVTYRLIKQMIIFSLTIKSANSPQIGFLPSDIEISLKVSFTTEEDGYGGRVSEIMLPEPVTNSGSTGK
jgi:hypothetical protein